MASYDNSACILCPDLEKRENQREWFEMRTREYWLPTALIGILGSASCASQPTSDVADSVYTNGKIYTVTEAQPWAEAVAIKDGRFLVVGSNADVEAVTGGGTEVVDLGGAFAMPGLFDIHTHPSMSMNFRVFCELPGTFYLPTDEMTVDALKECIEDYPDDQEWFFAEGYSSPVMKPETLTKEFLDELIRDRSAYVKDESGHFGWGNSKAFELVGIDENTPDTPEGFFRRTAGEPVALVVAWKHRSRAVPGHPEIEKFNADQAITVEETIKVHTLSRRDCRWQGRLRAQTMMALNSRIVRTATGRARRPNMKS
jgi:predicted amidohydrolase YtcJ